MNSTAEQTIILVPEPKQFQEWVQDCLGHRCLGEVGVSAATVSRIIGGEKRRNLVSSFLNKRANPGLNLSTAHDISCTLQSLAFEHGVKLPPMPRASKAGMQGVAQ